MIPLDSLLKGFFQRWERELEILRACGATEAAKTRERDIQDLRDHLRRMMAEELTLGEAAEWSGLSPETIRKKIARGKLENAGEEGRPRVLRGALPMRPLDTPEPTGPDELHLADRVLARQEARGS